MSFIHVDTMLPALYTLTFALMFCKLVSLQSNDKVSLQPTFSVSAQAISRIS